MVSSGLKIFTLFGTVIAMILAILVASLLNKWLNPQGFTCRLDGPPETCFQKPGGPGSARWPSGTVSSKVA